MTQKNRGRAGWHQATPKTSFIKMHFTRIISWIQICIVTLAVWGWIPRRVADWVLNRGGRNDD